MESTRIEAAKVHLITCFAEALRESISATRKKEWLCAASTVSGDAPALSANSDALVTRVRLHGTVRGELRLEIASSQLPILFPEAVSEAAGTGGLWQQVMEGMVRQLPKRTADAELFAFSVESHDVVAACGDGTQIGRLELIEADKAHVTINVLANSELFNSLHAADRSASRNDPAVKSKELLLPELGRVIDVPLSVTLRFGQRNMRLCEVLELNTGAVVELDRQVEDPVDLILDERVIARGEVVIVDGNYGLRVTEIVERHPTLVV